MGEILLQTCLPFGFLGTLHLSLDLPPRFCMGQKEEEASFTTMALNVFLATSTARRHCTFLSAGYKCNGISFFLGSCLGLCLLLCSNTCWSSFLHKCFLRWKLELHIFFNWEWGNAMRLCLQCDLTESEWSEFKQNTAFTFSSVWPRYLETRNFPLPLGSFRALGIREFILMGLMPKIRHFST